MLASELMSKVYTLHRASGALAVNELRRTLENAPLATLEAARKLADREIHYYASSSSVSRCKAYTLTARLIHHEIMKRRGY